jgi:REP element-mobilizing transposase RayT
MAQQLSIEHKEWAYLITTRTAGSRLWLINNKELESLVLATLARYQKTYSVVLYAFVIMGNHYHLLASFPKRNRALFMRDFNSAVARLVGRYVSAHGRRSVWARRYRPQVLQRSEDLFHWFYYVSLNPVSSGIVSSVNQYPCYNSFSDAVSGQSREYRWIDWSKYLMRRRYQPKVKPEDFSTRYKLVFSRVPQLENLSQEEYQRVMKEELIKRQSTLVKERGLAGKGFLGLEKLKAQKCGCYPRSTKTSARNSFCPLILTLCAETKRSFLKLYFTIRDAFNEASAAYRAGDFAVEFPEGTYPPPRLMPA